MTNPLIEKDLLTMWIEGRYALGWRGSLAKWILQPVINEVLVRENKLSSNKTRQ